MSLLLQYQGKNSQTRLACCQFNKFAYVLWGRCYSWFMAHVVLPYVYSSAWNRMLARSEFVVWAQHLRSIALRLIDTFCLQTLSGKESSTRVEVLLLCECTSAAERLSCNLLQMLALLFSHAMEPKSCKILIDLYSLYACWHCQPQMLTRA